MSREITVYLLPSLVDPTRLAHETVVVIDVLRATTTIVHALAAGASQVIPCLEVEEARQLAVQYPGTCCLGGERGGLRIEGFDFGNSPTEYTSEKIQGKTLIFTTTNGTRAMLRCQAAKRIWMGAFVNFSALCRELLTEKRVHIVCAGTDGDVTREDALLAGALAAELAEPGAKLNDQAELAADAWRLLVKNLTSSFDLGVAMRQSRGGRNLIEIGQENDIAIAAQIDKFDIAPALDIPSWRIRA